LRVNPTVIPHGIEWDEWQGNTKDGDYVLWNKNRHDPNVCDSSPVLDLAHQFAKVHFVSTFLPPQSERPTNVNVLGGAIPFDQMKKLVQAAGVYLATTKESWGIGILEAMASGVPVLGYAHGGILELVEHGKNGYLAKPGDVEDLAEGLNYCLKYRKSLGANGRELARLWTWQTAVEKVYEVYKQVMEPGPPTVGIVIPVYNKSEAEIERAIQSARDQTYSGVTRIVVVDDGSGNQADIESLVRGHTENDSRVCFIGQPNRGVAHARNRGISSLGTYYACCLDSDDWIAPDFIKACVHALEKDRSLGIAYTGLYYHKPDGTEGISPWPGIWDFDAQLRKQNQVPTCCVFRREMWERLGGYRQRYAPKGAGSEDAEFWTRAGAYGWKAAMVEPHASVIATYHDYSKKLNRPATPEEMKQIGVKNWDKMMSSIFHYSWMSGQVTGNPDYREVDYLIFHPWAEDRQHPFASYATPKTNRFSHPVRQYDQPVVSVIIPVGSGHEELVIDALDSLERQSFRNWEAIVVWDGPGFSENEHVNAIQRAYPYVKFRATSAYENEGQGAGWARNFGVSFARADFDADDWLYSGDAIWKMIKAWQEHQAIIYSDYVGRAFIDDVNKLSEGGRQRIIARDEETTETLLAYQAYDFVCEQAIRQPEMPNPYIFCNISCLVPKAWHDAIGGFDEKLPSWEDADYYWRMARAGYCFHRIEERLLMYRFYTGTRRDRGLQIHESLVKYIRDKYEREGVVGCSGCGGKRNKSSPSQRGVAFPSASGQAVVRHQSPAPAGIKDEDMVLVRYDNGNRGQHDVIGTTFNPITKRRINYGHFASGTVFYAHKDDVYHYNKRTGRNELKDWRFTPVEDEKPEAPKVEREPLPPPTPIMDSPSVVEQIIEGGNGGFDLQALPGVTDSIRQQLEAMDVSGPQDVLALGIEGLQKIKGIGAARAKAIIRAIESE